MQILEPALSVIGMIGSLILFAMTIIAARRESNNIAKQVRLYRETKACERYLDSLTECHRLLMEGFRVSVLVTYAPTPAPRSFTMEIMRETEGIVVSLIKSSWMCKDLGEKIRESAIMLRKVFSKEISSQSAQEVGVRIGTLLDTIAERIQEVLDESSD